MNFFKRQDETRRSSRRLVALFGLAVILVVVAVDLVVFFVLSLVQAQSSETALLPLEQWMTLHPGTVVLTTAIVLAVIGLASLYKTTVLGGGGGVVARAMGGVRISADTTDPLQRRLMNVVEEMAIASGVPMPEVYLLEQEIGINAFAAGHNPANAAIGVTRGTLTTLNRTELQGVVAHEFSHILNGDMRLNLRLMGLLFGLLAIASIGRTVLRLGRHVGGDSKKGGAIIIVFLVALAVYVIGYIGLFFGRLIQAAVSRSRESLADASAVQFTRDPAGLRSALVKIGAASYGSHIRNPGVDEVAHMLFAPGMSRLFATHPPLLERLRAIDPRFNPKEIDEARARLAAAAASEAAESARRKEAEVAKRKAAAGLDGLINLPAADPAVIASLVGNPGTAHMQLARQIRKSLPEPIIKAGQHPGSARGLLLALALDPNNDARERQRLFVANQLGNEVAAALGTLELDVDALEPEQRMPALLRAFPALRQLTREERLQLMACLNGMLQREGRFSLQSYALRKLAQVQLHDALEPTSRPQRMPLSSVPGDVQVLFSVLAQHGHQDAAAARRAYEIGVHHLYPRDRPDFAASINWAGKLDLSLSRLDRLAPVAKEQLVEAMLKTVTHDQQLTIGEAELVRAVCAVLHCPLPPLVA